MQYLNADTYCARNPDRSLSDAVGKSLGQYQAEQQRSAEASAPLSVNTSVVDDITHLSNVCAAGQKTTNIIISASSGGSSADEQIVVVANGRKVFDVNPRDIEESSEKKLVTIPCGGPVEIEQLSPGPFTGVSVFWPAQPGEVLTSTETTSPTGPRMVYPSATDENDMGYHAVMDS